MLCLPADRERQLEQSSYAGLWQPWQVAVVRPAWSAGIFGAPFAPVAWQLVQSLKGAATG